MNFDDIYLKAGELINQPIYSVPPDLLQNAVETIRRKTPKSAEQFERAKQLIPGGSQHMMTCKDPHSITIKRSLGAEMWDLDGNRYLDYLMTLGPVILGHGYPQLMEEISNVILEEGSATGLTSEWEIKACEQIVRHVKSVDKVRYFQSGTEANLAAVRLARAYTGKKKIIRIGGAYHGWSDEFVYDMQIPFSGAFQAAGIPEEHFANVIGVGPNDVPALEKAFEEAEKNGGAAALIVEPTGPETGALPVHPDFNKTARELCDRFEALLIFDEVVTGFRMAMGGAQEIYGIDADLTVFGKLITHGFPSSGALGGRKEVMDCLAGLVEGKPKPFVAGTVAGSSLTSAATYWSLKFIEEENAIEKANEKASQLCKGLNGLFDQLSLPFFSHTCASLVHFEITAPLYVDIRNPDNIMEALARKQAVDDLSTVFLAEGIQTKYGARAFLSMAHTEEHIEETLTVFEKVLKQLVQQS